MGTLTSSTLSPSSGIGSVTGGGGVFYIPPTLTVAAPPANGRTAKLRPGPFSLSAAGIGGTVTLGNGGYVVDEGLTPVGGVVTPGGSPAKLLVTSTGAIGNPTGIEAYSQGSYLVPPPDPASFIPDKSGSGFTAHISWFATGAQIIDPGSGYSAGPPPPTTASGCTGYGAVNCGSFSAIVASPTIAISGLPLCSAANTGQLCVIAAGAGQTVQVK